MCGKHNFRDRQGLHPWNNEFDGMCRCEQPQPRPVKRLCKCGGLIAQFLDDDLRKKLYAKAPYFIFQFPVMEEEDAL